MTSLLGRAEDASVQEGFLCPVCLQNCDSILQLQWHVESTHNTGILKSHVKDFFGKAKRFIRSGVDSDRLDGSLSHSQEHLDRGISDDGDSYIGSDPFQWENDLGHERSHWEYFLTRRSQTIDKVVVESNKLLLRLDKLVKQGPPWSDQNKRKAFEKKIVPWVEDSSSKFCRFCQEKFTLTNRKHHCRLCGKLLCNKCSFYMTYSYCECVLNPTPSNIEASKKEPTEEEIAHALRVCKDCYDLMENHKSRVQEETSKPMVVQLYEKISEVMEMVQKIIPDYNDVVECLQNAGENYTLEDANTRRSKILKMFDMIDSLSKKILTLQPKDKATNSATTVALYRRIRANVVRFLQETSLELKPLPSEEDLKRWKDERRTRRLEEERKARAQEESKQKPKSSPVRTLTQEALKMVPKTHGDEKVGKGWTPSSIDQASVAAMTDDPLLQQMNIISGYLNQALQDGKWDEANVLEENLKLLQREYREQEKRKNAAVAGFYE